MVTILRGTIYTSDTLGVISDGIIEFDSTINWVGPAPDYPGDVPVPPANSANIITPGLVDVHCHGGYGGSFPTSDLERAHTAAQFHHKRGVTSLLASTVSAPENVLLERITTLAPLVQSGILAGIHCEGPFLSVKHCGAQDPRYIRPGNPAELERILSHAQDNGCAITSMTLAPETPERAGLVSLLDQHGAYCSWGHSNASYEQTQAAITTSVGKPQSITHFFNGMAPFHHREPGMVAAVFEALHNQEIFVELIADGVHLSPHTISMMFTIFNAARLVLVSDAMEAAGLPDGNYQLGSHKVIVRDAIARINSEAAALAGSTSTLADVLKHTIIRAGVSPESAVRAATINPAFLAGIDHAVGSLAVGKDADIITFNPDFSLQTVYRKGNAI